MMLSRKAVTAAFRTGFKIGIGTTAAVTAASSAATLYVYQTDESWKRCIDFHILITPMFWDYYKFYSTYNNDQKQVKGNSNSDNAIRNDGDIDTEYDIQLHKLHKKYAPEVLQHILTLGGYYIKCAQMFCGMNLLPEEYEKEFSCLLDQVPVCKSFDIIEAIILNELGGNSIFDHFKTFDKTPIASASIGQVHTATLYSTNSNNNDKEQQKEQEVVVKIQYPEIERYFKLDVLSMKNLCYLCYYFDINIGMDRKSLDKLFDEFTNSFQEEFDYRLEAENMMLIKQNMEAVPEFSKLVKVPMPVKEKTTKKVLTMEKLNGIPIKTYMNTMINEYMEKQGTTKEEFENEMKTKFNNPEELQKLLNKKPPSTIEILLYRIFIRLNDVFINSKAFLYNNFLLPITTKKDQNYELQEYKWSTLPLDASRITLLLFRIHGHQLFMNGAFNADPHAGNILIIDNNNNSIFDTSLPVIGLVDFGNVQKVKSIERRKLLAKFYLSMSKDYSNDEQTWNNEEIARRFIEIGGESIHNNIDFLTGNALMLYDIRYDPITLQRFNIKADMSNIMEDFYNADDFKAFPADLVNLQRLCQTLVGVASIIGAGCQPSCSRMWEKECTRILSLSDKQEEEIN